MSRALRVERPDALLVGTFGKLWLATLGARMAGGARVMVRVGLSTDVSGAREGLEPGPDGQPPGLVTGFAPPEITSGMNSIVYDRRVRDAMGKAASERYQGRFSFEGMLDAWEAVLAGE